MITIISETANIIDTLVNNANELGPAIRNAYYLLDNAELGNQLMLQTI